MNKKCEENYIKDTLLLQSLIDFKKQFRQGKKDILSFFNNFMKKHNESKNVNENQANMIEIKENLVLNDKNENLSVSMLSLGKNIKNIDLMSQSMAEYFPPIEKNSSKIKI